MSPGVTRTHGGPEHRPAEAGARAASRLELAAAVHAGALLLFTAWDFGGETDFARSAISWWGTLAVPLLAATCARRLARREGLPVALRWLWPLLAFDALVLLGAINPSFASVQVGGARALALGGAHPGWPSSARPDLAWPALWQFNAIYLTAFNLVLAVVRRRVLRALLWLTAANALALSVFGTFQKLDQAPGLFFGLEPSPNAEFFASFIYHNHWGAFVLLATAAALGLVFHNLGRADRSEQRHSPVPLALVAILFLAATVPLSASRSCSVLELVLLLGAFLAWWLRRRGSVRSTTLAVAALLAALGAVYWLDRPVIEQRIGNTRTQLAEIRRHGNIGSRARLYADTWRMAREKPWFGWGLGSYGTVFQLFNTQVSVEGWQPYFAQAHSDWLQALAEVGVTGAALLALCALVPLAALLRLGRPGALPACLLAGCGIVTAYATVEFPFANPAVVEAYWIGLFAAIRYQRLTAAER